MKQQVLIIYGGDVFDNYEKYLNFLKDFKLDLTNLGKKGWKDNLQERLGEDFQILAPRMPNSFNARYIEWKIWFEKFIPIINENVILIGYSLGGIFLIKYLSENILPKKIKKVLLVATPFDEENSDELLMDFNLSGNFDKFNEQVNNATFFQSKDDELVSFKDFEKYQKVFPNANFITFNDRGHFFQPEFPELVEVIKKKLNI